MKFVETGLAGCRIVEAERMADDRGYFARTFCARTFAEAGLNPTLAQASVSYNRRAGTLRGLHFQAAPAMEDKLVRCIAGAVFDVAVDLRPGSPTYARWTGVTLSAENGAGIYVPKGFAHGFQTLTDDATVAYHIAEFFRSDLTTGIVWNDPDVRVAWPLPPVAQSARDLALPRLRDLDPALVAGAGVD